MPEWQPGPRVAAPSIPDRDVVLEPPNDVPQTLPGNPITLLLPVVLVVAMAGMLVLFVRSGVAAAHNPASLLFPAVMVLSSLGMMAHGRTAAGRTAEVDESRKDYLRYLDRERAEVSEIACGQRAALLWQHPDPAGLWTLAGTRRMWERGRSDSDYCHVRVGLGSQRCAAGPTVGDLGPIDRLEPVGAMALREFVRAHSVVAEVPIALALSRFSAVSVSGESHRARDLMRAMVCHLAVLHGPGCLAVTEAVSDGAATEWDWLKWLPHRRHSNSAAAHTVVVVDGGDLSGYADVVARAGVTVLARGDAVPFDLSRPSLRLDVSADELAVVGDVREVFACPDAMTVLQAEVCARRLAPYQQALERLAQSSPAADWAELVGIGPPWALRPEALWRQLLPHNRLRVPIGVTADGSPVELDLKEAAEHGMGPHGLCVGATGAGKSEFLRTLTLGLISTHDPQTLNLILIDFKGGATFLGLERARHVSAVITNLSDEAHLVARMRDALAGEMNRRQELLRSAGNFASVADYEQARAAGAALAPLPTLLVIVDEFSELLSQHPDLVEMFVAMGRLGRSLRMHLLLATQRLDEGRLRGLDSHLSYRVCLKTFSANESRAVIGTPDAFHLPATPGAAFLKVGASQPVAFQTAFVSGPCPVPAAPSPKPSATVRLFTRTSTDCVAPEPRRAPVSTGKTVLDTVLDRLAGRGTPAHPVWLPPLSESPTLDHLLASRFSTLSVPIGVVDRPFEQRRDPLIVELAGAAGNVAIVGAPQSGKSTAVRALVTALAATHTPEQAQLYCLDFGGGEFRIANCHFALARHHRDLALAGVADKRNHRLSLGRDVGIRLLRDDCADRGHTGGRSRRVLDESTPGDGNFMESSFDRLRRGPVSFVLCVSRLDVTSVWRPGSRLSYRPLRCGCGNGSLTLAMRASRADRSVPGAHLGQPVRVKVIRPHPSQERLLGLDDAVGGSWQLGRDLQRDLQHSMLVGVQEVTWGDDEAADLDRIADRFDADVRVRHRRPGSKEVKAHPARLVEIAHGPVGHTSDAAERPEDRRVDLTPQRAVRGWVVEVLDDDDPRRADGAHVRVEAVVTGARPVRPRCAAGHNRGRGREAHHPAELGKHAPDPAVGKADVTRLNVERLDRVGERRRVVPRERREQVVHAASLCHPASRGNVLQVPPKRPRQDSNLRPAA